MNTVKHQVSSKELREALGVSRVAVWRWTKKGMPFVSVGKAGEENLYDLAAIVPWLRNHNIDFRTAAEARRGLDELARRLDPPDQAPAPSADTYDADQAAQFLAWVFDKALLPWAARMIGKGNDPGAAIDAFNWVLDDCCEACFDRYGDDKFEYVTTYLLNLATPTGQPDQDRRERDELLRLIKVHASAQTK